MNELLHSLDWVLPLRSDGLTPLMRFFTLLGYEKFILFFLPLGYWAWNRGVFLRLLVLVALTALLNAWLKDFWQDPRPDIVLRMDHEVGASFGLPSGHAQIAVVIWFWLAWELRRAWTWLVAAVVAAGIIFSRLYLGAHDIEDVLGGALLGAATLLLFEFTRRWSGWREAHAGWHLGLIALAFVCRCLAELAGRGAELRAAAGGDAGGRAVRLPAAGLLHRGRRLAAPGGGRAGRAGLCPAAAGPEAGRCCLALGAAGLAGAARAGDGPVRGLADAMVAGAPGAAGGGAARRAGDAARRGCLKGVNL
jgi:membrane-associated phospholipid phosphatase